MKFVIERQALLKALAHVQSVVERRNTIPILSNVLIEADGEGVGLTATDMDLTIFDRVPADVGASGATTAPAHTLYDIVRKLPDGAQIELAGDGSGQLTLKSGRSSFSLATLPKEDFPAPGEGDMDTSFEIGAATLRGLIDSTRFAVSTEETRYYLNGIYIHAKDKLLRAVATDGHRLARYETALPKGAAGMPGVIVPRKTVGELRKLIDENDEDVSVALSDTRARFSFGATVITSKLIDGTFPDYERVIPSGNDKQFSVDRKAFAAAVDRVSTISSEKSRAVKLSVTKGQVTLSASAPDQGSAVEELESDYKGSDLEIGFNSRYLLDIAQQISGETASFEMADGASPTIITDAKDANALYVLMPMRV